MLPSVKFPSTTWSPVGSLFCSLELLLDGHTEFHCEAEGPWTLVLSFLQTLPPGMELPGKTQSIVSVITIVKLFSKLSVTFYVSTSNLSFCFSTSLQILDVIKLHFGEDLVDLSPSGWIPHIW